MSEKELVSPFRIAFREEGKFVNVYFARQDTMKGAFLLGSCARSILNRNSGDTSMARSAASIPLSKSPLRRAAW